MSKFVACFNPSNLFVRLRLDHLHYSKVSLLPMSGAIWHIDGLSFSESESFTSLIFAVFLTVTFAVNTFLLTNLTYTLLIVQNDQMS